jgi:hypothetical protein
MNVLDYQNNEEVMGGYDLKILHDGSKIEQEERNVTQPLYYTSLTVLIQFLNAFFSTSSNHPPTNNQILDSSVIPRNLRFFKQLFICMASFRNKLNL